MGISFGEYLPSSADRRQAEARGKGGHGCGAELPAELPDGGLEGGGVHARRQVVQPGAAHGDEVLERALVVVVQAAAAHGHDQQRCDPRPPAPRPAAAPGVVEHDD